MLEDNANSEDIIAYLTDRNLPAEEIAMSQLAEEILANPPQQGYLTISNALQWRLQYGRIVELNENVEGIRELPVNNLPILIIIIDTDFTDLHRCYCPKKLLSFTG